MKLANQINFALSGGLSLTSTLTGLGSETGAVTSSDTLLAAVAKINDRLSLSLGGTLTGPLAGAGGVVSIRNGATAQSLHLFSAYNDASNYARGVLRTTATEYQIDTEKAGGGAALAFRISYGGSLRLYMDASGSVKFGVPIVGNSSNAYDLGSAALTWRDLHLGRNVYLTGLPTADPAVAGQVWSDAGVLKVSAG